MRIKVLYICFLLPFLFINLYAQEEEKIKFQVSIGSTLSVPKTSHLTTSDVEGAPKIKSSINIGGFLLPNMTYIISKKTSLDLGLGFYLDRFSIEHKAGLATSKGIRNVSQIQVPVNINLLFGKNNSYSFGAGVFSGFLLAASEKGRTSVNQPLLDIQDPNDPFFNQSSNENYKINLKDSYNTVNFGAFIQMKKSILFSPNTKGFLLLKINQYINAIKNNSSGDIRNKNEKEPTTVNLGVGIEL